MIQTILSKVLEELNKENPKLDYIRGMIEVLLAMQEKLQTSIDVVNGEVVLKPVYKAEFKSIPPQVGDLVSATTTEAEILDAKAKAALETVKSMSKLE